MANQNLSQFTEKLFVADADHTFIWDTVGAISKRVSRNSWLSGTTADFHLGLADAASPVAQTISVQSVVAGTSNTAGANLSINGSQGTGTGAGGSLLLRTAPAGSSGTAQNALVTAVAITSAGNVGIGTTAPSEKLHVVGGAQFEAASPFINLKSTTSGQNYYIQSQSNAIGTGTGNYLAYLAPTGKGHTWTEATTTRMVIEPTTGNVGIGTTSPTSKLHVAGDVTLPNGGSIFFGGGFSIYGTTSATTINGPTAFGQVPIAVNGVTKWVFNYDGLFCGGGTTAAFPALKRSSTTVQARLADDTAFAPIQGKLTTDTAYTGTVVAATGYITIYDSTGTAYRVPCAL